MKYFIILIGLFSFLSFYSCRKGIVYTDNHLEFSSDTVIFDTVFTTVGSTTKRLKLYNKNALAIKIDDIELMGGESSPFNLNVDGNNGLIHHDIDVSGKDSLFMFIEVTLSVNNENLPLVVEDSIRFRTNGKDQYVNLVVWGQDAYFHVNTLVSDDEPWLNDKPHVIYGVAAVGHPDPFETGVEVINQTLTIPAGTQIFCHKNSILYVYKSTLYINGTLNNEVEFKHDRLESFYDENAGQWRGIILSQINYANINYTKINNAEVGLQVDTTNSNHTLDLTNTIIQNSQFYNLFLVAGAKATIDNCLFGDAGLISTYLFAGGQAEFKHCNFVNYWNASRGGPALAIKNWWEFEGLLYVRNVSQTSFQNCIMDGNSLTEFVIDTLEQSPALFETSFYNCLIKREEIYPYENFTSIIWNELPDFKDLTLKDFHFDEESPLNNSGLPTNLQTDIEGNLRSSVTPDIGVYEN